jgi:hypothetical protein
MIDDEFQVLMITAAEARERVAELEAERALAFAAGVADIDSHLRDLDHELDLWHLHHLTAAVTEIAIRDRTRRRTGRALPTRASLDPARLEKTAVRPASSLLAGLAMSSAARVSLVHNRTHSAGPKKDEP